ncbi:hypothetical protein DFQ27_003143 [Actinomortierella ambigua]|uniref:F-box domain-containing protein n=1 Tax=Actinomortierella ambigua TaxID=1343610 RepID=A0A9P6Q8E4_9FUNG|nr:hypothetical protein DFQ27_003143 [Actinomortierella ambigua]
MAPKKRANTLPATGTRVTRSATRKISQPALVTTEHEKSDLLHTPPCSQDIALQPTTLTPDDNGPSTSRRSARAKNGRRAASISTTQQTDEALPLTPPSSQETTPLTKQRPNRVTRGKKTATSSSSTLEADEAVEAPRPQKGKGKGKGKDGANKGKGSAIKHQVPVVAARNSKRSSSKADLDDSTPPPNGTKKAKRGQGTKTAPMADGDNEASPTQATPVIDGDGIKSRRKRARGVDKGKEVQHNDLQQTEEGGQVADAKQPKAKKAQAAADHDVPFDPLLSLPMEMWIEVFSYLYPSELVKFGLCSKRTHAFVSEQPCWAKIATTAELPEPRRKFSSYYEVVRFHDEIVCEQCFSSSKPKQATIARSDRPLPVQLDWNKQGQKIHLCRQCRGPYLTEFPQYDAEDPNYYSDESQTLAKGLAAEAYALANEQLSRLPHEIKRNPHHLRGPPMRLYKIKTLRKFARNFHGGFMGMLLAKDVLFKYPRCRKPPKSAFAADDNISNSDNKSNTNTNNNNNNSNHDQNDGGEGSSSSASQQKQKQKQNGAMIVKRRRREAPRSTQPMDFEPRYYQVVSPIGSPPSPPEWGADFYGDHDNYDDYEDYEDCGPYHDFNCGNDNDSYPSDYYEYP